MSELKRSSPRRRALVAAVLASLAAVAIAEDVVVQHTVDVKSGKTAFSPPIATVTAKTSLTVVKREGNFIRVRTPDGVEGYIIRDDLPPPQKTAVVGGGQVTGLGGGGASRGLLPDAQTYAVSKKDGAKIAKTIDDLIKLCDTVTDKKLAEFATAEHLGPKEFRK